ncbi:LysR family transcriptional regulator [Nocardiopsis aegyptia]|uniref:LysR family transcriptional regulator n=1 Tax=Nocardiopsis aegyptia TaxID=220378 RepID=UPI0036732A55
MERHEIEAFLVLAEELHFGRTAERLRVSTARISQTISRLERRVGAPLFERTSRRVALTPIGRGLRDDIADAHARVEAGFARAVDAGRGVTGTLVVGFVGAAGTGLLTEAADLFRRRHPECEVRIREVHIGEAAERLRAGDVAALFACLPLDGSDLTVGAVLLSEPRLLAVPAGHPFARRESVSLEDLARVRVLSAPCSLPDYWRDPEGPRRTPRGRPIETGRRAETFQEILVHIGAGEGVFPVGAHAATYHARPEVAYVPFSDARPLEWGLVWPASGATARVRAFARAAGEAADTERRPAEESDGRLRRGVRAASS